MTNDMRDLIRWLCNNTSDIKVIGRIREILKYNNFAKDKDFKEEILKKIDDNTKIEFLNVNTEVTKFITLEIKPNILINRYLLTDDNKAIVERIERFYKLFDKMHQINIIYVNSVLLHGESGTGKTTLGRYIAYKLNLPFIYLNFSSIINSYLGSTSNNLKNVFDFVRNKKCVLMIDEMDCMASERGKDSMKEMDRVVISMLQEIDKINSNIILIGATNRIDQIDKAIISRFSYIHKVIALNKSEREQYVKKYLSDIHLNELTDSIDISDDNISQRKLEKNIIDNVARYLYKTNKV